MLKTAHIALSVSNLEKSVSFYRKNFGLKCKEKFRLKPLGLEICILEKEGVCLELFHFKEHKPLPIYRRDLNSDLRTLGVKHFAIGVADIKATYKNLKNNKVSLATDIRFFENGLRYFFLKDPDGILVEVMEAR